MASATITITTTAGTNSLTAGTSSRNHSSRCSTPVQSLPRPFLGPSPDICPIPPSALEVECEAARQAREQSEEHLRLALQRRALHIRAASPSPRLENRAPVVFPCTEPRNHPRPQTACAGSRSPQSSDVWTSDRTQRSRKSTCRDTSFIEENRKRANGWIAECKPILQNTERPPQEWMLRKLERQRARRIQSEVLKACSQLPFESWLQAREEFEAEMEGRSSDLTPKDSIRDGKSMLNFAQETFGRSFQTFSARPTLQRKYTFEHKAPVHLRGSVAVRKKVSRRSTHGIHKAVCKELTELSEESAEEREMLPTPTTPESAAGATNSTPRNERRRSSSTPSNERRRSSLTPRNDERRRSSLHAQHENDNLNETKEEQSEVPHQERSSVQDLEELHFMFSRSRRSVEEERKSKLWNPI